ncbi:hypothetical protein MKQ68_07940 [Chitinophaga horti]|uniref:DoxX family protein n=1 Tax=Chitinophaga horti TaxID=2920382 RepID=A0ABY6J5Y2_9BACT|nr:hypothetical protein [Chitinophaga horti]UYQ95023.1 hypothetical protein MKQ68_07940 [Chitinophaga horti]
MTNTVNLRPWTYGEMFALRFCTVFFVFYIIPFPLDIIPGVEVLWETIMQHLVPWVAQAVLHVEITVFENGSGDTTYNYVEILLMFSTALIAASLWSLLDRRRWSYHALHYWLRVLVRYYLAYNMFRYGFIKVFHLQMGTPYLTQLIQPFGDKSPMGLAWSYMGFSPGFSAFTGWAEVLAGALLLYRRTVTIGAMVGIVVTINIMAVNYFFDVPVKLFSTTLFLMSVFLLVPDLQRLANMLLFNKPVEPKVFQTHIKQQWLKVVLMTCKGLYISFGIFMLLEMGASGVRKYGDRRTKPPLWGIYDAYLVVRNGDTIPPLRTDYTRWNRIVLDFNDWATVYFTNDSMKGFSFEVDTLKHTAVVYTPDAPDYKSTLHYIAKGDSLTLTGKYFNDSILISFTRRDHRSFQLMNRGFHWINEYPYNR